MSDRYQPAQDGAVLQKAMDYLARREHSQAELRWKLRSRGYEESAIEEALDQLMARELQSDERFTEAFVQSRYQRGHGPCKIRLELSQKGVHDALVDQIINQAVFDWFDLARSVYRKKYRDRVCSDYQERAKRSRFLQQRGFSSEQIQCAIDD